MDNLRNRFTEILNKKFHQSFPETFIKSQTRDQEVYKNANGSMYSWYIRMLNSFNTYSLEGPYKYEPGVTTSDEHIQKFLTDFEETSDWLSFLIKYMPVKYY